MSAATQTDAFGVTPPVEDDTTPEDLYTLYLRDTQGLSDEWEWFEATSAPGDVPEGFLRFRGAEAPRKPRAGTRDWRKRDKATERTFFVARAEWTAWCLARAERLDECLDCRGSGQRVVSVGIDGVKRAPCRKCRTTGKHFVPPEAA